MAIKDEINTVKQRLAILRMVKRIISTPTRPGKYGIVWPGNPFKQTAKGDWDRYLVPVSKTNRNRTFYFTRLKGTTVPVEKTRTRMRVVISRWYEGLSRLEEEFSIYINGALAKLEIDIQTLLNNLSILERRYAVKMQGIKAKKEAEQERLRQEAELLASKKRQAALQNDLKSKQNLDAKIITTLQKESKIDLEIKIADKEIQQAENSAVRADIQIEKASPIIVNKELVVNKEIDDSIKTTMQQPADENRMNLNLDMIKNNQLRPNRKKAEWIKQLELKAEELPRGKKQKVLSKVQDVKMGKKGTLGIPTVIAAGALVLFLNK